MVLLLQALQERQAATALLPSAGGAQVRLACGDTTRFTLEHIETPLGARQSPNASQFL
jgi:hypothetical protein